MHIDLAHALRMLSRCRKLLVRFSRSMGRRVGQNPSNHLTNIVDANSLNTGLGFVCRDIVNAAPVTTEAFHLVHGRLHQGTFGILFDGVRHKPAEMAAAQNTDGRQPYRLRKMNG